MKKLEEERGPAYDQVLKKIIATLFSQSETAITAIEGVDALCRHCPQRADERCTSPMGNEDVVRKWDAILLRELGLPPGTCLTSGEWRALIDRKKPFKVCHVCRWKQECRVWG